MNILNQRTFLKILHWAATGIILYFFLVEPDLPESGSSQTQSMALSTHAGMGFILAILVLAWTVKFYFAGLTGKPGPKLSGWARAVHPLMHKGLHFLMPVMLLTGLAVGLSAPFAVVGFGFIPLNIPGLSSETLNDLANELHEISFDALVILIGLHAVYHIWRHYFLKDNALRLMLPKMLHKYL